MSTFIETGAAVICEAVRTVKAKVMNTFKRQGALACKVIVPDSLRRFLTSMSSPATDVTHSPSQCRLQESEILCGWPFHWTRVRSTDCYKLRSRRQRGIPARPLIAILLPPQGRSSGSFSRSLQNLIVAGFLVCAATVANAGVDVWTSLGSEGGTIHCSGDRSDDPGHPLCRDRRRGVQEP